MDMILTSVCDVCGIEGERRFSHYFPGYRLPDPIAERSLYIPTGWHYVEGMVLCSVHSYRVIIEQVAQLERPCIEIEQEPGARAQPFVWRDTRA